MNKNYYQILGVKSNASHDEIKSAYKKLALKFHPDKNNGDAFFENLFKDIQEAYECLSNDENRKKYDHEYGNSFQKKQQSSTQTNNPKSESTKEDKPIEKESNYYLSIFGIIILFIIIAAAINSNNDKQASSQVNNDIVEEIPPAVVVDCVYTDNKTAEVNQYARIVDSMKQIQNTEKYNSAESQFEENTNQEDKEVISFLKEYYKFYNRDHIFRNPIVKKTDVYNYDVSVEECISKDNFKNDEFFWHAKVIQISRQENGDLEMGRRFY